MSNFDLLDRYFSNELDKSELKAFNERLKTDPQFNQEFQEIKEIKLAVKLEARKNIKSLFTDIEDSLNQEELTTNNQTAMKRMLTVAASLILMVSVSYFVLNGSGQPSPKDVFTEYYKPYNNLNGQVRGESINTESMSAAAYSAYDAGNYALAVENFEVLVEVEKTAENYFYMGIANIEIGNYETAVKSLNTTLNNFSTFKDQSKWYLSMALLADKKEEEALSSLISLSMKKNSYSKRSKEALTSLGFDGLDNEPDGGPAVEVIVRPDDSEGGDSPDGSMGKRQIQFGEVKSLLTGDFYRFHNETPIKSLEEGDYVEFIILKKGSGRKSKGWAFILDSVY
ncbi:hypothetical protein [Roseivirga sp. E12]|uniref:hypothetical protein n=1 Tax=Roseivirga sp. E12 TaxID=2819237 RepID=UPI001ABCB985|nr:hypothetical protein [Roseivirga sp. E12]